MTPGIQKFKPNTAQTTTKGQIAHNLSNTQRTQTASNGIKSNMTYGVFSVNKSVVTSQTTKSGITETTSRVVYEHPAKAYGVTAERTGGMSGGRRLAMQLTAREDRRREMQNYYALMNAMNRSAKDVSNPYAEAMKAQMTMQAIDAGIEGVTGLTGAIVDAVTSGKSNKTTSSESDTPSSNGVTSKTTASLNEMSSAKDSTALSAAIDKAIADLEGMPNKIKSENANLAKLQEEAKGLEQKENEANANLENHINNVIPAQQKVVEGAKRDYDGKASQYTKLLAQSNPPALPADIEQAKQAMDAAKQAWDNAKATLEKLQGDDKNALEADLRSAKEAHVAKQKEVDEKDAEIKSLEQDKAKLTTEIPKQKKRLEKLKEKDNKDITSNNADIEKLRNEINNSGNAKDAEKIQKKKTKLDELQKKQDELKKRQAIARAESKFINGSQFKQVTIGPETIYLIDGKEVSEDYYKQKKAKKED